jgi:tetratricopeptide (TPR) repeat protein
MARRVEKPALPRRPGGILVPRGDVRGEPAGDSHPVSQRTSPAEGRTRGEVARATSAKPWGTRPSRGDTGVAAERGASALAKCLVPCLLIGAGLAVYLNSFAGVFLMDDHMWILDNPRIREAWPPWTAMANSTRPLVQLSLAANYAMGGLDVRGYHAFNVTVHLLAGLALFGIVRRMLESAKLRAHYGQAAPWLAGAIALIWLVHPLQTESVTYIIQRAESLMGLFYLLTLYCVIRGAQSPRFRAWYAAAVMACASGMASKEIMVSAPLLVLLYDRVFIAGSFKAIVRQRAGLYVGLAATWFVLGALLTVGRPEQMVLVTGLTPWRYALTQFGVIAHYLRLAVWPHPLILDYTWPLADRVLPALPWAAVVLALVAGTLLGLYRQAWVAFWGAWFFLILAPTSTFLPIADVVFEHRMYLPLAAVVVLIVIGAHEIITCASRRRPSDNLGRWIEAGLTAVAIAGLGYATVHRNQTYRSELAMWSDNLARRPDNPRVHLSLGAALQHQGRFDEAIAHYSEAIRLKPDYQDAHDNLGVALTAQGKIPEAIVHLEEALRLRPDDAATHGNLGWALLKQGDVASAIRAFSTAVRLKPDVADAHIGLGNALYLEGRFKEAISHGSEAIRLAPTSPEAHHNLGLALAAQGDAEGAISHFSEAIRLKPDYAKAHNNLGASLYARGQVKEAIAQFLEALRLDPGYADARNNLREAQASQRSTGAPEGPAVAHEGVPGPHGDRAASKGRGKRSSSLEPPPRGR